MSDVLPIPPFTFPAAGSARVPGSKSLTNRALALAALCHGPVRLTGALASRDTRIMIAALRELGLQVEADEAGETVTVNGEGPRFPIQSARLDVGNAGTAARFLTAMLCLREGGTYVLDGDAPMRERPMAGLTDALATLGARFEFHGRAGHFPYTLHAAGLAGGAIDVDASASSQILSALLIALAASGKPAEVALIGDTVSHPFVEMTVALIEEFDVPVGRPGKGVFRFDGQASPALTPGTYEVEPDATAASYFLMLPAVVGGELLVEGLCDTMLQGDIAFTGVLVAMGMDVCATDGGMRALPAGRPQGVDHDFTAISDTFLTLAAVSPLLAGPTRITGIAHTRKQETDRVAAMAAELTRLGQQVDETEGALTVTPDPQALVRLAREARSAGRLLEVDTYADHRFAMSFAILGCHDLLRDGKPWLAIRDPQCCAKTFPGFFEELARVRQTSAGAAGGLEGQR